jgi:hypothetical protein
MKSKYRNMTLTIDLNEQLNSFFMNSIREPLNPGNLEIQDQNKNHNNRLANSTVLYLLKRCH